MVYCASLQSRLALGYDCSGMHTCAGAIGTVPILLDESDKTPELGIPVPNRRLVLCRMFVERMRHDTLLDVPSHPVVPSTTQDSLVAPQSEPTRCTRGLPMFPSGAAPTP